MLSSSMLRNLSNSYEKMGKYQDQLATGKKINRPSDDPVVAMKGIQYRTNLAEVEQFKRNFSEAYNWIENSDSALDKATSVLQRIRELTVQASNGTYEKSQRESISAEIGQLKEHLESIANTKVGNKYIFNGTDTTSQPVSGGTVSSNSSPVEIELSKGVKVKVNVTPSDVFTRSAVPGEGLFTDLENLINDLSSETGDGIGDYLGHLDTHTNKVVSARAELGARINRMEMMEARIDEQEVIANRMLSDNEDADIERVITDLKTQESVHRAALSVGSRIIQPTLMDFLR